MDSDQGFELHFTNFVISSTETSSLALNFAPSTIEAAQEQMSSTPAIPTPVAGATDDPNSGLADRVTFEHRFQLDFQ